MKRKHISQKELKENLHYNPDTGIFTWIKAKQGRTIFSKAGWERHCNGGKYYIFLRINNVDYLAHRLAFLYMKGFLPEEIDHDDGNGCNNRWLNLKEVSHLSNMKNRRQHTNNKSGQVGVGWHKKANKWRSHIVIKNKHIHLGLFDNKEQAIKVRKAAEVKYGFHPNHGKQRPL